MALTPIIAFTLIATVAGEVSAQPFGLDARAYAREVCPTEMAVVEGHSRDALEGFWLGNEIRPDHEMPDSSNPVVRAALGLITLNQFAWREVADARDIATDVADALTLTETTGEAVACLADALLEAGEDVAMLTIASNNCGFDTLRAALTSQDSYPNLERDTVTRIASEVLNPNPLCRLFLKDER